MTDATNGDYPNVSAQAYHFLGYWGQIAGLGSSYPALFALRIGMSLGVSYYSRKMYQRSHFFF